MPLAILVVGKCLIQQYFCLELLYTSTTYEIPKTLSVTIPVEVDEPSLIKVTTYLKKYSVKADYTITMTYRNGNEANDREVNLKVLGME